MQAKLSVVLVTLAACGNDDPTFVRDLPFSEPDVVSGAAAGVVEVALESAPADLEVSRAIVRGEAFNGVFVGPTIHLEPGDQLRLDLTNRLEQHTNVHFHGFHVSPSGRSDDIFRHIAPGETADYVVDVPATHDQGMYWYHSHMHFDAESQVFQGLSGVIQIGDVRRLLPDRFRNIRSRVLALKDLQVEDGAIVAANIDSNAPTMRTVNGLVEPVITDIQPGTTELWNIANIGADIFYDVTVDGVTFTVLGEDGNPVESTFDATHLVLAPGKRWEVLVTFPDGARSFRTLAYDQGGDMYPDTVLAHVEVQGDGVTPLDPLPLGTAVRARDTLLDRPVVAQRTWEFTEDEDTSDFFINGMEFDPDRVDVSPRLDTVEEWTLRNSTTEQHPFHIHINDFRVMSIGGVPYDAHGKQDTVILPPGEDVVVRIPFDDFTGKFVFHCHILAHEDHGMMAVVDVPERRN